ARWIEPFEFWLIRTTTFVPVLTACRRAEARVARIVLIAPTPTALRIMVPANGIATRIPIAMAPMTTMFSTRPKPRQQRILAITRGRLPFCPWERTHASRGRPEGRIRLRRGREANYWTRGQRRDRVNPVREPGRKDRKDS